VRLSRAALAALLVVACGGPGASRSTRTEPIVLPGPAGAPPLVAKEEEPRPLEGVSADDLNDREKRAWWKFLWKLYAPCSDQAVSIGQCIEDKRPCAACTPAAKLLAAKVKEGATTEQMQTLYGERFGPNVRAVDVTGSPAKGPENAPVQIVEWMDFECPHCKAARPMLDDLVRNHDGQVRLVKKFYVLPKHERAEPAARAAIAAMNQSKFWDMEKTLFDHQKELEDDDIDKYATDLKLDLVRMHADMKSEKTDRLLKRDRDEAENDGLDGTPFILINGRYFDLRLFHLETDLEPWVVTELGLKK